MHGLRHAYALDRYEDLTGWKAPLADLRGASLTERDSASTSRRAQADLP